MGYPNALAIAAAPLSLDEKLKWHQADFSSRIPDEMILVWAQAIWLHDSGAPETTLVDLPEGSTYCGKTQASIANIIVGYNLEYFTLAFASEVPNSPLEVPLESDMQKQLD